MMNIEDKILIQELVNRFAHCSDYRDWAGMEKLFTPDVVTELEGMSMKYEGIPSQVEHARESDVQTEGKNRHHFLNMYIEEDGGQVFAYYYFINTNAGSVPMGAKTVVTGRQRDTVVKTADGWKISHRLVRFDQSFELNF